MDQAGTASDGKAYRALVRNRAQLAYNGVGAWLEGRGPAPAKVAASADLAAQLKLQDAAAQRMVGGRFQHGALDLETIETRPVMLAEQAVEITRLEKNRATSLIEEFMVAANGVIARTFEDAGVASIRRIVRTPKRWDRIVEVAAGLGTTLPAEPDSKALNDFLLAQKQKDPDPLSRPVADRDQADGPRRVRAGEAQRGLARPLRPGRAGLHPFDRPQPPLPRRGDAAAAEGLAGQGPQPYSEDDLNAIATHCTLMEDNARKVEREMQKRIAAVVLQKRIGQSFPAIVTGVNKYGTFVRTLDPHVEGMVVQGGKGLDVGDKVTAKLVSTDPQRGFIDFAV